MPVSEVIQLATLVSVIVGCIGLMVSIRAYRRQVNAQFLLEYTRRFDQMLQSLPPHMWAAHVIGQQEPPEPNDELTLDVLRCLNLLGQMHYFSHAGFLPPSAWRRNRVTFARVLGSPLFRREWKTLAPIFATDREFCRYVESVHRSPDLHASPVDGEDD